MTEVVGLRFVSDGYDRVNLELRDYQRALQAATADIQRAASGANTAAQMYLKQVAAYKQTAAALDTVNRMQRESARAAQEIVNRAAGVTNAYKSAAESAAVFTQALRTQEVETAKTARAQQQLIAQTLGINQPYRSAKESADVFVQSQERARQAYDQLRAAIDPAVAAQQRLADAQRRVDAAVQAGIITRAQGSATMVQYRSNLTNTAAAMLTSETAAGKLRAQMLATANSIAILDGPLGGIASRFSAFGVLIGRAGLLIGGALVGFAALGATLNRGTRSLAEWEATNARVNAILETTGQQVGLTTEAIRNMTSQIALNTLENEQGVMQAAQRLLTFRDIAGEVFEDVLNAAADMSALGFGTIESETVKLAKALEDPAQALTSLSRAGIVFTRQQRQVIISLVESGRQAEAMERILSNVNARVGGAAEAAARDTLAGAFDTISQAAGRAVRDFAAFVLETTMLDRALQGLAARVAPFAAGPETTGQELARRREDVARLRRELQEARQLEADNPFVRAFGTAALSGGQRTVRGVEPELARAQRLLQVAQDRVRAEQELAAAARARQMLSRDVEALESLATEIDLRRELVGLSEEEQRLQRNLAQLGLRGFDINQRVAEYERVLREAGRSQSVINDLTEAYREQMSGLAAEVQRAMDTTLMERTASTVQGTLTNLDQQNELLAIQLGYMQQGVDATEARQRAEEDVRLIMAETLAAMDPANALLREMADNLITATNAAREMKVQVEAIAQAERARAEVRSLIEDMEREVDLMERQLVHLRDGVDASTARRRAELELQRVLIANLALEGSITKERAKQLSLALADLEARGETLRAEIATFSGGGGGGSSQEVITLQGIQAELLREQSIRRELLSLSGEELRAREVYHDLVRRLGDEATNYAESQIMATARLVAAQMSLNEQIERQRQLQERVGQTLGNLFIAATRGADAFRQALSNVVGSLAQLLANRAFTAILGHTGFGGAGSTFGPGGFLSLLFNGSAFANGAAFAGGNVIPFASGGVVNRPTMFPMAQGRTGLMGEAGPEAILPLRRGRDGRLGVSAETPPASAQAGEQAQLVIRLDPSLRAEMQGEMQGVAIRVVESNNRAMVPTIARNAVRRPRER